MIKLNPAEKKAVTSRFTENALRMMKKRYLVVDEKENQETPADMFARVAGALARVEEKYKKSPKTIEKISRDFFDIMSKKEYTPAGRTLRNAGSATSLIANCVVMPIHDSMESIFGTLRDSAMLQQTGCGLGFDLSEMRPSMFPTKKSQGIASGPVSFLRVYDAAFGTIKQQCFAKGTLIVTKRGLIPIEEVRVGDETFTEKGWKKITEVFSNGVRDVVRLTLDNGFSIEVTPNHKVAVLENNHIVFKEAGDLTRKDTLFFKLGDEQNDFKKVALEQVDYQKSKYTSSQLKQIRQPSVLDEDLAYFLGWYFADGWNDSQGIGLVLPDNDHIEKAAVNLAQELFSLSPLLDKEPKENCRKLKINSLWVRKYLERNGLLKQHSPEIRVPSGILSSPSSVQLAFVTGFFEGDGDNGAGKNYRLSSTSEKFLQEAQLILLANGIGSTISSEKPREEWRRLYRLSIAGKIFTEKFYEKASRYSWKIRKQEKTKDFSWIFPFHPVRDLGYSYSDIKSHHDGMRATISYSILSQIQTAAFLQSKKILETNWLGFLPARIKNITPTGKKEVYDFEVEDVHMINAGLYTSNSRHGANMAMMRVDHPDILDFIHCKEREGELRNFNISVTVTDEFMKLLQENPSAKWMCKFNGKAYKPRRVLRRPSGSVYSSEEIDITVKEIFDQLVEGAWRNGEPGIAFIDTANRANPLPDLGPLASTNPCGEQYLHPYDNCNLGSINLAMFVKQKKIDWPRLRFATRTAVRLMDNVIDLFDFPVPQVTELARKNRRIGLGIMGFADMLYQLGIGYNTKEGFETAEKVMKFIDQEAYAMSQILAAEKGAFPNYQKSVFAKSPPAAVAARRARQTTKLLAGKAPHSFAQEPGIGKKMRNAALTTVAPTGSISMMFDCSSGVEPYFALAYVKQDKDGNKYHYFNKYFEEAIKKLKLTKAEHDTLMKEVIEKGTIQHLANLPKKLKEVFVVAMDISGKDHMKMQASFQKYVDNSISKTINFPNATTKEEIAESFMAAWKLGCKSATVYREGSRVIQILNIGKGENIVAPTELPSASAGQKLALKMDEGRLEPRPRPEIMKGHTYRVKTGYGNMYFTINSDEKGIPFEVFATIGKSGGFYQEQSEAICRLISLSLRSGVKVEEIVDQLKGIRGPMPIFTDKGTVLSLPDAMGRILEEHAKVANHVEEVLARPEKQEVLPFVGKEEKAIAEFGFMPGCPDCGSQLLMQEGCMSCKACGFSRCT
ncbi:MAG: adenosylcobalamin-dependent ribonucleoside-diphosphate reductase [Candidatus Wildermuthbacteria bacterium]|nr:adenosylcobalamin-dependent ribonucleoside-diphosphate reductase [Candidatus Wildermuthbacteria bacterium]